MNSILYEKVIIFLYLDSTYLRVSYQLDYSTYQKHKNNYSNW